MIDSGKKMRLGACCIATLALLGGCLSTGKPTPEPKLASAESSPECPDPRPMVVVAEFDAGVQDVPQEVGPGLADMLVAAMTETGCYRMIDPTVFIEAGGGPAAGGPDLRGASARICSSRAG